jgi:hypothetical protein
MASKAEQIVSRSLRTMLGSVPNGGNLPDSEHLDDVLGGLMYLIPDILREVHDEWDYESLDGIIPIVARKAGELEAEILGMCYLISDQRLAPIHIRLQVSPSSDEILWLECRLGERGEHGMVRVPYEFLDRASKRLHALAGREDRMDWVYKVTFGHRSP